MQYRLDCYTLLAALAATPAAWAAGVDAANEEIAVLKEDVAEINARLEQMFSISGYTDIEYVSSTQEGTEAGFRLHHLSLFFEKQIEEKWRFFSEIEYEDAPRFEAEDAVWKGDTSGKIFAEAVNLSFTWRPDASFRMGRFFTPAGIWSVDHYPPFVPTQERPLHVRNIFPQVFDGVMLYGTRPAGGGFVKYDLYYGNGEGNPGKRDRNADKAAGLNVSLLLPLLKHTELGATYYRDPQDSKNANADKTAFGGHAKIKVGSFAFQGEYARGELKPVVGADYRTSGFYTQFLYDLRDWTVGYRHSLYNANLTGANALVDDTLFVNYHVSHNIVLKLEHHRFDYDDETKDDYHTTIASVVAYLGN
jgi:hypothetical protein